MADESHLSVLAQGVEQGHAVLADAVTAYTQALGERLVAAYALGSLAHGGFSPLVSDVDLALILADPLRPTDSVRVAAVTWGLKAKGSALHDRLSVFWGTPSSLAGRVPGGRFPRSIGSTSSSTVASYGARMPAAAWSCPTGTNSSWLALSSPLSTSPALVVPGPQLRSGVFPRATP